MSLRDIRSFNCDRALRRSMTAGVRKRKARRVRKPASKRPRRVALTNIGGPDRNTKRQRRFLPLPLPNDEPLELENQFVAVIAGTCLGAPSTIVFIAANPFSNSPPHILSMFMKRPNALQTKFFSPDM